MLSNKLISLLETFPPSDLISFKKYLASPFFNENENLSDLFELIVNHLKKDPTKVKQLKKQDVWKKLFGSSPYQDVQFRRICSDLTKMAFGYLTFKEFKKSQIQEQTTLLSALNHPQLDKHFVGVIRQIHHLQDKMKYRNENFHFYEYRIEQIQQEHQELLGSKASRFDNLERADFYLDCFYIIEKLNNYCDVLWYKKVLSIEANIQLLPNFLENIANSPFMADATVKAFYTVTQMLLNQEQEDYFFQLMALIKDDAGAIKEKHLLILLIHLKNYCIDTKINTGHSEYFLQLFEIFQLQINKELILENDLISPQNYKNIISVGLHLKEFDWVEDFIQKYTTKLPKENQDNSLNYNLAKVYFYKEDYVKVIELLREVEYRTLVYSLGGKLILLKTYYELKEFMVLDSLLDSFRIYLRRNRLISREVKQQYMNVLRFTKKLANLSPGDDRNKQKVREQIQHCKALAAKRWLLEKVEEVR